MCSVYCAAPSDEEVQNAEPTHSRRWTEHFHFLPLYVDKPKISQKAARESGSIHLESGVLADQDHDQFIHQTREFDIDDKSGA